MLKQDVATAHKKDRSIGSIAERIGAFGFIAIVLSGCIIVVPPPNRKDPFQPPGAAPMNILKGKTHRMRLDCGAQATFRANTPQFDNLVVEYHGENLNSAGQVPSAPVRLTWRGPGASMDVPVNVGSKNTRVTAGNVTLNGAAGTHELLVVMPTGPDCGPVNFKIVFR